MALQDSPPIASPETPATATATVNGAATSTVTNGAVLPVPTARLPRGKKRGKLPLLLFLLAGLLLLGAPLAVWAIWFRGPQLPTNLVLYHVEYKDLQLKIVERGSLEARKTYDVVCQVKTGSRGAAKIKSVVDNGTEVEKGQVVIEIDDSYLQEQMQSKSIDLNNARADMVAAEETYPQKQKAIELAKQAEVKWRLGDFPQTRHDLESKVTIAKAILQQQKDRTTWVGRMVKKGYMTASQESAEEDNLRGDQLSLQNYDEQLDVLLKYTNDYNQKSNENAIKQAIVDERTANAKMISTEAVFKQQDDLYKDLKNQVAECVIRAPESGIVVYYIPAQTRGGFGSSQSTVAQGEPVQFGQVLIQIPDLKHMVVNLRVHEAFINHVKPGMKCSVRVSAAANTMLKGHVKSVAAAAAQQDWMSPDVKVYQTYVEIDGSVEALKLKPGLSADTTIYTDVSAEHVLAVPVQAVLPPVNKDDKPHVFVMTPSGAQQRDVVLGITDDKFIEVKEGVNEGDDVVLNPRALLSDKDKKPAGKDDEKVVPSGGRQGGGAGGGGKPKQ